MPKLSNQHGEVTADQTMALCRCGASKNKPFCDGTHKSIGFSSENQANPEADKIDSYVGEHIIIHDNRSICAHAGYCTDELASVFRHRQTPFVDPDGSTVEAVIEIINKCPSGALSYSLDGTLHKAPMRENVIFIAPNGPYVVTDDIELTDTPRAEGCAKNKMTLCRCGASKNKPFCDGSHWHIDFKAD